MFLLAGAGNMHLSDKFDIAGFSKGLVEAGRCLWKLQRKILSNKTQNNVINCIIVPRN